MRRVKVSAFSGFAIFFLFLSALAISSPGAPAAACAKRKMRPSANVSVSVKMIDMVDSSIDPPGKQYRASVTKLFDAGNGKAAPQGSAAIVTLAQTPNGWSAQLSSLTVAGQSVPVTSISANVTAAAQTTAGSVANSVGSVFGGLGRRAPPPAVMAVATGQRVILPPGTPLTFVLGAAPSAPAAEHLGQRRARTASYCVRHLPLPVDIRQRQPRHRLPPHPRPLPQLRREMALAA